MGSTVETEIRIENASPESVIARLADGENIGTWSTFIRELTIISGHTAIQEGCRISVKVDLKADGKLMEFKPRVLKKTDTELRWLGVFGGFLFYGEHYFVARRDDAGTGTILTHGEIFTGVLAPLFKLMGLDDTRKAFVRHNEDLRRTFESSRS
jgi:hypothetical protein